MKKLLRITGRIVVGVVVAGTLAFGTSQAMASGQIPTGCDRDCLYEPRDYCYDCCGAYGSTFCHWQSGACVCDHGGT
jgi:hypothetical protein